MSYIKSFYVYLCFLIPVLLPNSLNACAVCFGAPDDPMTQGMRWGIATLLFILIPVLGGVGGFFIFLFRRGREHAEYAALQDPDLFIE
jgi:hypothetical protein|tara:strand:+ start:218 stop:481 length:264 start_codon:yes stop_codon:yes gene_type:complete